MEMSHLGILGLTLIAFQVLGASSDQPERPYDKDFTAEPYYIDKTDMIRVFFEQPNNTYDYISCPKGFGKTTLLQMIKSFANYELEESGKPRLQMQTKAYVLFRDSVVDMNAAAYKQHMAQHPVIFVSLKANLTQTTTEEEFLASMNDLVHGFVAEFPWLQKLMDKHVAEGLKSKLKFQPWELEFVRKALSKQLGKIEIQTSLLNLTKILCNFFNKPAILLVDDYDYVAHNAMLLPSFDPRAFYKTTNQILGEVLGADKGMISRALIVGISRLAWIDNFTETYSIANQVFLSDHKYGEYIGFLVNDVRHLCNKHKCDKSELEQVQDLYDGYETKLEHRKLYNTESLIGYFKARGYHTKIRPLKVYWNLGTGEHDFVTKFLRVSPRFHVALAQLMAYNTLPYELIDTYPPSTFETMVALRQRNYEYAADTDDPIKYLIPFCFEYGLLGYTMNDDEYVLPSAEVHQLLSKTLAVYYKRNLVNFDGIGSCLRSLLDTNTNAIKALIPQFKSLLDASLRLFPHLPGNSSVEYVLQSIVAQAAAQLVGVSLTQDTKISRKARCDVVFSTPGNRGTIVHISFTSSKTSQIALKQCPGFGRKKHSSKSVYIGVNLDSQKQTDIMAEVKTPRK